MVQEKSFRLLTEYHSFLYWGCKKYYNRRTSKFPSPYGVSFILMDILVKNIHSYLNKGFPSPYGVSFILIDRMRKANETNYQFVSVSLRSIIHSYIMVIYTDNAIYKVFPSPYGVSFILMSDNIAMFFEETNGFRLLTEYHSFLYRKSYNMVKVGNLGFRLLTEYHSFLLNSRIKWHVKRSE